MSTARVVSAWTMVVAALTARIITRLVPIDDARRHPEQIDHRRDEDEAAADAEEDGQHAGEKAERERRDGRDVEARAVEAPAQRQRGDPAIVPRRRLRRRLRADIAERDQRILQHEDADPAEDERRKASR